MSAFDTKFLDLLITSLEIISKFTVVGNATIVGPQLLQPNLIKLKKMKADYLKFTIEYEKKITEALKKIDESTNNN